MANEQQGFSDQAFAPVIDEPKLQQQQPAIEAPKEPEPQQRPRTSNSDLLKLIIESGENAKSFAQQVVEAELTRDTFDQDWRMAKIFAWSGAFADIKGVTEQAAIATAMAKIQLGRSWGISAADSMRYIYFNNGKPAVETELFASKLMAGGYRWDTAFDYEPDGKQRCIGCTVFPKEWSKETGKFEPIMTKRRTADGKGWEPIPLEVSFSKIDADNAMIWEKGKQIPLSAKWNFVSWPEDMYFWRALSKFRRRYAPNVLAGAMTQDEIGDMPEKDAPKRPLIAQPEMVGQKPNGTLVVDAGK